MVNVVMVNMNQEGYGGQNGYWLVTGGNSYNLALNQGTTAGGTNGGGYS